MHLPLRSPVAHVGCAGQCPQARQLENDFGLRLDWGSRPLRGASWLGDDRGCSRWPCFRAILDRISTPLLPPPLRADGSCGSPLHCVRNGRSLGARCRAIVFCADGGPLSEQHVRVCRGRFCDLSLRLRSASLHCCVLCRARGLLYVLCGYPASKGGILWAISPAGRRFRASALVSGRKNHDVYTWLCIHVHLFLLLSLFATHDFLSGRYGRFSYIVLRGSGECGGACESLGRRTSNRTRHKGHSQHTGYTS
jgi:hypothetical protein